MTPYYQDSAVTIYHGDCREILPCLGAVDVVVTDPPYGTGWVRGTGVQGEFRPTRTQEPWDIWSMDWLRLCSGIVAFFGPYSRREEMQAACDGMLWWRKTNPRPLGPDLEPIGIIGRALFGEFASYNGDTPFHPCQKSLSLMMWILRKLEVTDSVCDPYMGSGTTLRAAKDLGCKAIGIEIEERYCEIAAKRMAQSVFSFEETA